MLLMKNLLDLLLPCGSESFVSMAMARLYTTDAVNRGQLRQVRLRRNLHTMGVRSRVWFVRVCLMGTLAMQNADESTDEGVSDFVHV